MHSTRRPTPVSSSLMRALPFMHARCMNQCTVAFLTRVYGLAWYLRSQSFLGYAVVLQKTKWKRCWKLLTSTKVEVASVALSQGHQASVSVKRRRYHDNKSAQQTSRTEDINVLTGNRKLFMALTIVYSDVLENKLELQVIPTTCSVHRASHVYPKHNHRPGISKRSQVRCPLP